MIFIRSGPSERTGPAMALSAPRGAGPFGPASLVPQRFTRFQRVLNPLLRFPLSHELQKRLALEVEQMLLGHRRRMAQGAAPHHRGQRAADQRIVVANPTRAER